MAATTRLGEKNPTCDYAYVLGFSIDMSVPDHILWCHENLRSENWELEGVGRREFRYLVLSVSDDTDAMLVRLRWPDCEIVEFDAAGCVI